MRIYHGIFPSALMAWVIVLTGCGPNEKVVAPAHQPSEDSVTQPRETQAKPVTSLPTEQASRWNTYHGGSSLDGIADATLPDELTLLWRFKAGAPVRTTPVAGGDRIYFANAKGRLFAVDLEGNEVWSRTISREAADRGRRHRKSSTHRLPSLVTPSWPGRSRAFFSLWMPPWEKSIGERIWMARFWDQRTSPPVGRAKPVATKAVCL